MSNILDIRRMGSILERKSRGRIWNNRDTAGDRIKSTSKKKHFRGHIHKNWDKDLWDY